jgi:hypothetical protein
MPPSGVARARARIASYSGTTPLLATNSNTVTRATGTAAVTPSRPSAEHSAPAAAMRMSLTRWPLWSPAQLQA